MTYNQGSKSASPPTYYESSFNVSVPATDSEGNVNFTPKAEGSWTLAQLTALCPVSHWDTVFASQYDSVITNPPDNPVPDTSYVIPE